MYNEKDIFSKWNSEMYDCNETETDDVELNTGIIQSIRRFEMTLADGSSLIQEIPVKKHFATLEQVHTWLEHAGFIIENEWGDYYGNPINENTHRAIIWARKK